MMPTSAQEVGPSISPQAKIKAKPSKAMTPIKAQGACQNIALNLKTEPSSGEQRRRHDDFPRNSPEARAEAKFGEATTPISAKKVHQGRGMSWHKVHNTRRGPYKGQGHATQTFVALKVPAQVGHTTDRVGECSAGGSTATRLAHRVDAAGNGGAM